MKPNVLALLLAISSSAFGASSLGYDLYRRNANAMRRQTETPIVGNLTNAQAQAGYNAQCSLINSASGQAAIETDIQNVTRNSLAIDVCCSVTLYFLIAKG